MAQAKSRKTSPEEADTPRSAPQDADEVAEETAKASAEEQLKPRTAKQQAKAEEEFDADERVVLRSSYGDPAGQVTRHGGYQYFDPENPEGKPAETKGGKTAAKAEESESKGRTAKSEDKK